MIFLNFSQLPESVFRLNFSLIGKCFLLINFSNNKQIQKNLKNNFSKSKFKEQTQPK
jgi:lauroyl/myristoyl acyltransferase